MDNKDATRSQEGEASKEQVALFVAARKIESLVCAYNEGASAAAVFTDLLDVATELRTASAHDPAPQSPRSDATRSETVPASSLASAAEKMAWVLLKAKWTLEAYQRFAPDTDALAVIQDAADALASYSSIQPSHEETLLRELVARRTFYVVHYGDCPAYNKNPPEPCDCGADSLNQRLSKYRDGKG